MLQAVVRNSRFVEQGTRVEFARIPHPIVPVNGVFFVMGAHVFRELITLVPRLQNLAGVTPIRQIHVLHLQVLTHRVREALLLLVQVKVQIYPQRGTNPLCGFKKER